MDTGSTPLILGVLSALGAGTLLSTLASGAMRHLSGHSERERARNADALSQRDQAWAERNAERARADLAESEARGAWTCARIYQEYASLLRRMLIEGGTPVGDIPPFPVRPEGAPGGAA